MDPTYKPKTNRPHFFIPKHALKMRSSIQFHLEVTEATYVQAVDAQKWTLYALLPIQKFCLFNIFKRYLGLNLVYFVYTWYKKNLSNKFLNQ